MVVRNKNFFSRFLCLDYSSSNFFFFLCCLQRKDEGKKKIDFNIFNGVRFWAKFAPHLWKMGNIGTFSNVNKSRVVFFNLNYWGIFNGFSFKKKTQNIRDQNVNILFSKTTVHISVSSRRMKLQKPSCLTVHQRSSKTSLLQTIFPQIFDLLSLKPLLRLDPSPKSTNQIVFSLIGYCY